MDQLSRHQTGVFNNQDAYEKVHRLLPLKNQRLRILDVGYGSGLLGNHLLFLGHDVVGLDAQAPNSGLKFKTIATDLTKPWPELGEKFDLVICTDVAEHLYDPLELLLKCREQLKSTGKIIFGVPNHFDLRQRLSMLFGRGVVHWDQANKYQENSWHYSHIRFFSLRDLAALFKQARLWPEIWQFNFMAGGLVPTSLTPEFFRSSLLKLWPGLFSGKFVCLLSQHQSQQISRIYLPKTPQGY